MKLQTKYILFIALIHVVTLVLTFFIFKEQKVLFIASEFVILLSLYFAFRLYKTMVQPLKLIMSGIDAIRDRDFNVKFQPVGQFELDKLIQVYNEMINQLREERTFQAQQHYFLDKLIQTSPSGIIILDYDGNIANCNPKAELLLGIHGSKSKGKSMNSLAGPLAKAIAKLPENETQTLSINGIETYKCHKAHFIDRGFPLHFIIIEELTVEKLRIEKNAYGKVIRMMAHEVNNSIGPINSIISSVINYAPHLPAADQEDFQHALQVAKDRNGKLNQFMRKFADVVKLPSPNKEPYDLIKILEDVCLLMKANLKAKSIQLSIEKPSTPVFANIDVLQMEQVLINVIKNAIEAIEIDGCIKITLKKNTGTICVMDNGIGIEPNQMEHLFSPFYSTKTEGQGIGLTLTREVLINHGFDFSLQSNTDGWTVFEIKTQPVL